MIPPFLKINIDPGNPTKGQVISHEGRHRASALIANGEDTMQVALILAKDWAASRSLTVLDMPEVWRNEYIDSTFRIERRPERLHIQDFVHEIIRSNVQEEYQKHPIINDGPLSLDEFMQLRDSNNPPDSFTGILEGLLP
jgi:hypothetical protein